MLDLSKFKASKKIRCFNGKTEIAVSDFVQGETVTVSAIDSDGNRENTYVVFSMELVNTLQEALENNYRAITLFKK